MNTLSDRNCWIGNHVSQALLCNVAPCDWANQVSFTEPLQLTAMTSGQIHHPEVGWTQVGVSKQLASVFEILLHQRAQLRLIPTLQSDPALGPLESVTLSDCSTKNH